MLVSCAQWLEAELQGVDRCVTPWLLVGMHRPMYVPYPHKSNRVVGRHLQACSPHLTTTSSTLKTRQ